MSAEVYYPARRILGHRIAWALERALAWLQRRRLCAECGETARFNLSIADAAAVQISRVGGAVVMDVPARRVWLCRPCAWNTCRGQPPGDDDNEPPGAGADPYGRPSPSTHPEFWTE